MNKPYFAKYLVANGHFQYAGANIRHKKTGQIGKIKKVGEGLDETQYEHVKLFLCSRDIQVGDKVYMNDSRFSEPIIVGSFLINGEHRVGWYPEGFQVNTERKLQGVKGFGNYGKVIGEISPDATWAKEGDEFDEDKISIWEKIKPQEWKHKQIEQYKKLMGKVNPEHFMIRLKGPCGHFH